MTSDTITPLAALRRLSLDWGDIALMQLDLRRAIARSNQELLESFS